MYAISTAAFVSILALASSLAVVVQAAPPPAGTQPPAKQPAGTQPASTTPGTAPPPHCAATYDVKPGDTCVSVAASFHLSKEVIVSLNAGKIVKCDDTPLPKETLCIKPEVTLAVHRALSKGAANKKRREPVPGSNCKKHVKATNTKVDGLVPKQNLPQSEVCRLLKEYNQNVNRDCNNLQPGHSYCVGV